MHDHNGCPTYEGSGGDRLVLGDEGFYLHRRRNPRRSAGWNYEYVEALEAEAATFHYKPRLRIISYRLASTLVMAFDTVDEAEQAKEALTDAATRA